MKHKPYIKYLLVVDKLLEQQRSTSPQRAVRLSMLCHAAVRARLDIRHVTDLTEDDVWTAQHIALEVLRLVRATNKKLPLSNVGEIVSVRV